MKLKTVLPAILAVVLGGAAAYLVRNSMLRPHPSAAVVVTPKMIPAVVATDNLMAGQELTPDNLTVTEIPSSNPPGDTIANPVELVGRVLGTPIAKGSPIHQASLAPRGVAANLPSLVPPGMRAITINVDEGNSLSGMLTPGCHVDVVATFAAGKESQTRTLVYNVLIQATGQRLTSAKSEDGKEPPPYHTATLIVSPRNAQMIDLAVVSARLRLLLRPLNHGNGEDNGSEKVTMAELTGADDAKPTATVAFPTTNPSANNDVTKVAYAQPQSTKRDVTLILGNVVTHVKVEMPEPAPTIQVDTSTDRAPIVPEDRERNQD